MKMSILDLVVRGCAKRAFPLIAGWLLVVGFIGGIALSAQAQPDSIRMKPAPEAAPADSGKRDVLDYVHRYFPRIPVNNSVAETIPVGRAFAWILPSVSYEPQTKVAVSVGGNIAFRTVGANVSSVYPILAYTQNKQLIFHTTANVWFPGNRFNLTTDWRLLHYPQQTYGLGGSTSIRDALLLSYDYIRLYQTLSRNIAPHTYIGGGYSLDYRWAIKTQEATGDAIPTGTYDLRQMRRTVSSGLTLNLLYDDRSNLLNPGPSFFANVLLRENFRFLGSDSNYPSLMTDVRKYINLPAASSNILAFWNFNNLTLGGVPPYLDLPSTGWDANSNSGRGHIQGRFRGRNLLYAETEYRFRILRSGLLGGVLFSNVQSVSEPLTNRFARLLPAGGAGIRVKLNKLSGVNLAVDYGMGTGGFRSVYFNIGEMF